MVTLLLAQARPAEAFAYAERAKSRALLDLLAQGVEAKPAGADPNTSSLTHALATTRDNLNRLYLAAETGESRNHVPGSVVEAERRVVELTRDLERLTPTTGLLERSRAPDADEVCAGLPDETVLLEYGAHGDTLSAFVLTRCGIDAGVRAHTLGSLTEVQNELNRLNFFLTRVAQGRRYLEVYGETGLRARTDKHLGALYDLLIRPLGPLHPEHAHSGTKYGTEPTDRPIDLIIVPHGPLLAVPFAALFDGSRYLIDHARLSVAPSAAVYLHCRSVPQHRAELFLALGVPAETIPAVQGEIRAVAAIAEAADNPAETVLGEEATLAAFFARAPHAGVLHLATHGVYRPDNPVFSGLRLFDGWLTARDLYTLELRATLVVLSACESALGSQGVGDEQFGLARGFLYAGAPALVASLWPVKDEQTTLLIRALYTRLYRGENVRAALRAAQLELRAAHPNPYYWAAFTVVGDPERTVSGSS